MTSALHTAVVRPHEPGRVIRWLIRPLGIFGALWLIFYGLHAGFPNIRSGADVIFDAKVAHVRSMDIFPADAAIRVAVFGDSKILSGFKPDLFDTLAGGQARSFNVAMPGSTAFMEHLEAICARGQIPTHVLIQQPWSAKQKRKFDPFRPPIEDSEWMKAVFPFKNLPRNFFLFVLRSRTRGGLMKYYKFSGNQAAQMIRQRGYYFIEGQSHFPNNRLPDHFRVETDNPKFVVERRIRLDVPEFARLRELADRHNFKVIFFPSYVRTGQNGEPPEINRKVVEALAPHPRFRVAGPDYVTMPNAYFSDPTHTNPEGAEEFTRRVAKWILPEIVPAAVATLEGTGR